MSKYVFFWSVFSRIWTEYEEVRGISPYSVQMRENTGQKKLRIWTLHAMKKSLFLFVERTNENIVQVK